MFGSLSNTLHHFFSGIQGKPATQAKLGGAIVLEVLAVGSSLAFPFLAAKGFLGVLPSNDPPSESEQPAIVDQETLDTILYLVGSGATWIGSQVFATLSKMLINTIKSDYTIIIDSEIIRKYTELPFSSQADKPTGAAVSLLMETYRSENLLPLVFSDLTPSILHLIAADSFAFFVHWQLGTALLGSQLFLLLITYMSGRNLKPMQDASLQKVSILYSKLISRLSEYTSMHLFDKIETEIQATIEELEDYGQTRKDLDNHPEYFVILQQILTKLFFIGLIALSVVKTKNAEIALDNLFLILIYLLQLDEPIEKLSRSYRSLTLSANGFDKIFEYTNQTAGIADVTMPIDLNLTDATSTVTFKDVCLTLGKEKILEKVNFTTSPGKKTVIIGMSGGGKTILGHLLLRFHEPDSGKIFLNDIDITQIRKKTLRKVIGLVPQNANFSNKTIREIISYASPNITDEEIQTVLKRVKLDRFVNELDYNVGTGGQKISGGQKQRLAIAQTFLKDSVYLYILDEATSALDIETAGEIDSFLDKHTSGISTLVITHNILSTRNADDIIVLKDGTVHETGTFEQLIAREEYFYTLVESFCKQNNIDINHILGGNHAPRKMRNRVKRAFNEASDFEITLDDSGKNETVHLLTNWEKQDLRT